MARENPHANMIGSLEPPPHAQVSMSMFGVVGVIVSIITFLLDIESDAMLAYLLWRQAEDNHGTSSGDDAYGWFVITVVIIILPMVILNILSFVWYWQNRQCLGDYCILHKMTIPQKCFRGVMHLLLLGPLMRYVDTLFYGLRAKRATRHVLINGQPVIRRTPLGEVYAVLQMVIARDAAMLDMLHSFLQDCPQLVFQVFLLYRSPAIMDFKMDSLTVAAQAWKVSVALFAMSWSLVTYQDELRKNERGKQSLGMMAVVVCLLWRVFMLGSRVLAIASFAAIQIPHVDDGIHRRWAYYSEGEGYVITYPVITAIVLSAHWILMIIWIHAQKTNFCAAEDGSRKPVRELLYNVIMGWVHCFCYINLKDSPTRLRMTFFYIIIGLQNTVFISVWYVEVFDDYEALWFKVTIVFLVELLFVLGLCALIGYYAFLHPECRNQRPRTQYQTEPINFPTTTL
ncbi:XK-related protein 6-like isoform X2 [Oratosquilla oratoria]|uniref:XK-related protein 6-like isoform X2 n=1 Tax=Oratosquilla oratoria TaxID=337810 RepID=UPI003F773D64